MMKSELIINRIRHLAHSFTRDRLRELWGAEECSTAFARSVWLTFVAILLTTICYMNQDSELAERITRFRPESIHTACPMINQLYADAGVGHPLLLSVSEAASKFELDSNLVLAVMATESKCRPNLKSSRGAQGLMQLMPKTALWLGVKNPHNSRENILGGAKYLSVLLKQFDGRVDLALAAYNAGPLAVRQYGGVPPFKETRRYVQRVTFYLAQLRELAAKKRSEVAPV